MAEIREVAPSVIVVLGSPEACDAVSVRGGGSLVRISPREVLVVTIEDLGTVSAPDGAYVEDVSDGWAAFVVEGDDAGEVWARVSELGLPEEGAVTGEVARVSATAIVDPGRITILTPAMWGHHLRERLKSDAAEVLS